MGRDIYSSEEHHRWQTAPLILAINDTCIRISHGLSSRPVYSGEITSLLMKWMEALGVSNRNIVSSLVSIGLAAIFLVGSLKYGFGSLSRPGPGLLPFFASVIAIFLSGIIFFGSLSKRKESSEKGEKFLPDKGILIRQTVGVLSLFGYGVALEYLGFAFTTVLFMVVVLRFVGLKKNWAMILGTSLVTTLICYLLFVTLLKSQLPRGIFL